MNCPSCQSSLEHQAPGAGLFVDTCPKCAGIWLDSGEVTAYFRLMLENEENLPNPGLTAPKATSIREIQEQERSCPRCDKPMNKFNYGYDSNIILDRCPQCSGVWVDGNEVKPLATFLKGSSPR